MAIKDVLADFEGDDFVTPRIIRATRSFNGQGISLYYYIYGKDSDGLVAGLKLDFFRDVRFTNFKKPHSTEKYKPYFDQFIAGWYCSHDDVLECFASSNSVVKVQLDKMARHWKTPVERFTNTLLLAYMLLLDAEDDGWLDGSDWDGGDFGGSLPSPKR
ncbi:hypothetical protein CDG76_07570 [Nostoc sp. 'Peltigera membranacea cyanobiont' 210A]|uniref:hypothetical protein n=1 Tax=Nostoc sp. 'Peltigera membranacea cyanobiont' 210A TaxID=2014529 RepID=UPI000B954CD2|nr:hypothetical protein [Nostoc sp. 'Peltigera membranacea cyanobiont' 210A]OYD96623.1 hypothetical protein CDG76_07570 [Nostoc sp. 'Peltigera membranacea cyanobiont' 210A]